MIRHGEVVFELIGRIATSLIWDNEGHHVRHLQTLNDVALVKRPCGYDDNGTCSSCDMSSVRDVDLVYVACGVEHLTPLNAVVPHILLEIREGIRGDETSAYFSWFAEVYQYFASPEQHRVGAKNPPFELCRSELMEDIPAEVLRRVHFSPADGS